MKNLVFIENGTEEKAEEVSKLLKRSLHLISKLDFEYLDSMKLIFGAFKINRQDLFNILFNPENCILTYSMYLNESKQQLFSFLEYCGSQRFQNLTYVDGSGKILSALKYDLWDSPNKFNICISILSNNILTVDSSSEKRSIKRLKVDFDKENLYLEDFNLKEFLENEKDKEIEEVSIW